MTVLSTIDPKHLATPCSAPLISHIWENVQTDQQETAIQNPNGGSDVNNQTCLSW